MNYYNPYFFSVPSLYQTNGLQSLFSKINISSILNGTGKALNLINQAIPIIKEAAPMMKNAKTMFKVMNEFKKIDTPVKNTQKEEIVENKENNQIINYGGPTFFA